MNFEKSLTKLKEENLSSITFEESLLWYTDFWIIWIISIWKKWNQEYFINATLNKKSISFCSKTWFTELFIEWNTILKFKEWVETIKNQFIKIELEKFWFTRQKNLSSNELEKFNVFWLFEQKNLISFEELNKEFWNIINFQTILKNIKERVIDADPLWKIENKINQKLSDIENYGFKRIENENIYYFSINRPPFLFQWFLIPYNSNKTFWILQNRIILPFKNSLSLYFGTKKQISPEKWLEDWIQMKFLKFDSLNIFLEEYFPKIKTELLFYKDCFKIKLDEENTMITKVPSKINEFQIMENKSNKYIMWKELKSFELYFNKESYVQADEIISILKNQTNLIEDPYNLILKEIDKFSPLKINLNHKGKGIYDYDIIQASIMNQVMNVNNFELNLKNNTLFIKHDANNLQKFRCYLKIEKKTMEFSCNFKNIYEIIFLFKCFINPDDFISNQVYVSLEDIKSFLD